jgi:hypothetical protein
MATAVKVNLWGLPMPGVCPIKISHSLKHIEVQKIVLNKHNLSIKEKITKNGHNHQNCSANEKIKFRNAIARSWLEVKGLTQWAETEG